VRLTVSSFGVAHAWLTNSTNPATVALVILSFFILPPIHKIRKKHTACGPIHPKKEFVALK